MKIKITFLDGETHIYRTDKIIHSKNKIEIGHQTNQGVTFTLNNIKSILIDGEVHWTSDTPMTRYKNNENAMQFND